MADSTKDIYAPLDLHDHPLSGVSQINGGTSENVVMGDGSFGSFPEVPTALSDLQDDSFHRLVTDAEKATWNSKYSKPSTGIPKSHLASAVQYSLNKADTALQSETDPTVPSWAKQTNKPSYTASEVGAVPAGQGVPAGGTEGQVLAKASSANYDLTWVEPGGGAGEDPEAVHFTVQSLNSTQKAQARTNIGAGTSSFSGSYNDLSNKPDLSQFITKSVNDLTNYYLKSETYTQTEINNLIGAIDQFHYEIAASTSAVTSPASNVLYLIGPTGSGSDKYEEYVYSSNTWVKIGDTSIDLSGYVTTSTLNTALAAKQDLIDSTHKLDYSLLDNTPTIPAAGIPSGGSQGQVLKKSSATNYDVEWADESGSSSFFVVTPEVTPVNDIKAAYLAGSIVILKSGGYIYNLDQAYPSSDSSFFFTSVNGDESELKYYSCGVESEEEWWDSGNYPIDTRGKADKVSNATTGHLAALNASGNLVDSGIAASAITPEIFWAEYGVTDFDDIVDAYNDGLFVCLVYSNIVYTLVECSENDHEGAFTSIAGSGRYEVYVDKYSSQTEWNHAEIGLERTSNKVSSWSTTTNDTRYPSEKLVKDSLDAKQATIDSNHKLDYSLLDNTPWIPGVFTPSNNAHAVDTTMTKSDLIAAGVTISAIADMKNGVYSYFSNDDQLYPITSVNYDVAMGTWKVAFGNMWWEASSNRTVGCQFTITAEENPNASWSVTEDSTFPKALPAGGTQGQVLKKSSNIDYAVEWANESGGGTTDVFWVTFGTTTYSEVAAAVAAGKVVCMYYEDQFYTLQYDNTDDNEFVFVSIIGTNTLCGMSLYNDDSWGGGDTTIPSVASLTTSEIDTIWNTAMA